MLYARVRYHTLNNKLLIRVRKVSKLLLILVFSLLFVWPAIAGTKTTESDQAGILGPVRTVFTETIKFLYKFDKRIEGPRNPSKATHYDTKGNIIEEVHYNSDGSFSYRLLYTFDSKGKKIEGAAYQADGIVSYRLIYTYDATGNMADEAKYNTDGSLMYKMLYTYDAKGNMTEEAKYKADGSLMNKMLYAYDASGNRTKGGAYQADGSISYLELFVHDDKGRMTEEAKYKADGSLISKRVFKFDPYIDTHGNWTKKTLYVWVSKFGKSYFEPFGVTYRKIIYYEY